MQWRSEYWNGLRSAESLPITGFKRRTVVRAVASPLMEYFVMTVPCALVQLLQLLKQGDGGPDRQLVRLRCRRS
jgi:hypothetical protein